MDVDWYSSSYPSPYLEQSKFEIDDEWVNLIKENNKENYSPNDKQTNKDKEAQKLFASLAKKLDESAKR